ncbi:MAG: hypothetical protein ACJAXX_000208 [Roseivirga sp.]|jgi:hypothetical protein
MKTPYTKVTAMLILVVSSITYLKAQDHDITSDLNALRSKVDSIFTPNSWSTTATLTEVTYRGKEELKSKNTKGDLLDRSFDINNNYSRRGTDGFVNVYIGLNNYLEDGDLPNSSSLYNLNPLTSWYAAVNFDNITHVVGPLYLNWGIGISMQDFSFENTRVEVVADRDNRTLDFVERIDRVGKKSKINVTHINLQFVPTFSFGRFNSFRVGAGVYGGYRIGSHAKYKYDDLNGDSQKDKFKNSLFINPFKYGLRAQIGWQSFDLFFNYDLTEMFEEDVNAPRLTPITFGVIF